MNRLTKEALLEEKAIDQNLTVVDLNTGNYHRLTRSIKQQSETELGFGVFSSFLNLCFVLFEFQHKLLTFHHSISYACLCNKQCLWLSFFKLLTMTVMMKLTITKSAWKIRLGFASIFQAALGVLVCLWNWWIFYKLWPQQALEQNDDYTFTICNPRSDRTTKPRWWF